MELELGVFHLLCFINTPSGKASFAFPIPNKELPNRTRRVLAAQSLSIGVSFGRTLNSRIALCYDSEES